MTQRTRYDMHFELVKIKPVESTNRFCKAQRLRPSTAAIEVRTAQGTPTADTIRLCMPVHFVIWIDCSILKRCSSGPALGKFQPVPYRMHGDKKGGYGTRLRPYE